MFYHSVWAQSCDKNITGLYQIICSNHWELLCYYHRIYCHMFYHSVLARWCDKNVTWFYHNILVHFDSFFITGTTGKVPVFWPLQAQFIQQFEVHIVEMLGILLFFCCCRIKLCKPLHFARMLMFLVPSRLSLAFPYKWPGHVKCSFKQRLQKD